MRARRIGILTGGGDVQPLNAVIASAARAAVSSGLELVGFVKGWQGVLDGTYVSLAGLSLDPLIGGTILKSSRVGLEGIEDASGRIAAACGAAGIEGLIVVGGDDTLSNCFHVNDVPQVLIPKTIDNDVGAIGDERGPFCPEDVVNYFTLGHPTAAARICSFVSLGEGLRTTAYSHERLIVVESMGMHAGWLALSAGMAEPDFIVIPEFPVNYARLRDAAVERFERQRHVIIVAAEGARWDDGSYISADETETDAFGHPRFKGAAETLARRLKRDLRSAFDTRNVNAVNPSYLYRSGRPVRLDLEWGTELGRIAVESLRSGVDESVLLAVRREGSRFVPASYPLSYFGSPSAMHRLVDARFYDPRSYAVTAEGKRFFSPIVDELPLSRQYGIPMRPFSPEAALS